MNKVIIFVDDEIRSLKEVLLSIQSVLFSAKNKNLNNAPQDNDTEICVLHLVWQDQSKEEKMNEKEHFNSIKEQLEERQQNILNEKRICIPSLKYSYIYLELNRENYPENCRDCKNRVSEKIEKICNKRNFVIMLDLVLNKKRDMQIVLDDNNNLKILSQMLYEEFEKNTIPYTNYGTGEAKFRQRWKNLVNPQKELFERGRLVGNAISGKFKREFYKSLDIGGDVT